MAAAQQTIQYQTLLKNKGKLTNLFRTSISSFVDELYANGLISQKVFETKTDNNADPTKAKEMTMCVLDCVSKDPGKYRVFMSMKAFELSWAKIVHEDLTKHYDEIRNSHKAVKNEDGERLALSDVINALWRIRAKFYNLGLNLGIDEGTLDTFRKKDIDDAFSDVIKTWLRRAPVSSWKIIIEALRRPSLNEEALANEIAKMHCPSELVLLNTGPPSPVKDLTITNNLEDHTVTFMWTYDNAVNTIPATSFNVTITPVNGGIPITVTVSINDHSLTLPLSQLVSKASYRVSVVATNQLGGSIVIKNTFTSPGPPSPVKDLTITNNLDDRTVTFMWTYDNAVNSIPATSFNVTVTPINGGNPITESVSINDHSLTLPLSQLVSEASYRVSVVATNQLGRSVIIDSTFTSPGEIKAQKIVKSGQITNYDQLFNDLSKEILDKYLSIGIELGLPYKVLSKELETGVFTMKPTREKAMKMLQLWRDSVGEERCTYSVLSAALEKHGLRRCAHKYCYTSSISSGDDQPSGKSSSEEKSSSVITAHDQMINKINLDDATSASVAPGKSTSLPSEAHDSEVYIPLCTSEDLGESIDCSLDSSDTQDNLLSAAALVSRVVVWTGRKELSVKFLNIVPPDWTYAGSGINIGNIMSWANEWSLHGNGVIPRFTLVQEPHAPSDIRIKFTSNGRNEAKIGNRAAGINDNKPTMWLDLHSRPGVNDDHKKHLVVHEFGHALGLGHKHQRSNFWKHIKPYVDVKRMKAYLRVSDAYFIHMYSNKGTCTEDYDPHSVMHYWFCKDWLTNGYSVKRTVEEDTSLPDKVRAALLDVHERDNRPLAIEPSDQDIRLLVDLYGDSGGTRKGPTPAPGAARADVDPQGLVARIKYYGDDSLICEVTLDNESINEDLEYKWYENDTEILREKHEQLRQQKAMFMSEPKYKCVVAYKRGNTSIEATSNTLTVKRKNIIAMIEECSDGKLLCIVEKDNERINDGLKYQWCEGEKRLEGETDEKLGHNPVSFESKQKYRCEVLYRALNWDPDVYVKVISDTLNRPADHPSKKSSSDEGPPSPVKDLSITNNLDDHTVTFMWTYDNAVNSIPATSFTVTVTLVNGGNSITETVSITDHSLTLPLSQLVSEESYRVSVVATNQLGGSVVIDNTFTSPGYQPLTSSELNQLNIVLAKFSPQLKEKGLNLDSALFGGSGITKEKVVLCLQEIGQDASELAEILRDKGIRKLQEHMFESVYKQALTNEQYNIKLHAFKMILCGVPRSGKSTFWQRIAVKDFKPSVVSASTRGMEYHCVSAVESKEECANIQRKMLFDFQLYSETDTSDLDNEALCIYKHILENHKDSSTPTSGARTVQPGISSEEALNVLESDNSLHESDNVAMNEPDIPLPTVVSSIPSKESSRNPISEEIRRHFQDLNTLLREKKVDDKAIIGVVKKLCHLIDAGGQRACMEMLPTVVVGKALYLLFFSYEKFEEELDERVQVEGSSSEVNTGTKYKQMDVIMKSLICVSTTTSRFGSSDVRHSSDEASTTKDKSHSGNVAMLVGTHADKVSEEVIERVNEYVKEKVEPFLKCGSLVFAKTGTTLPLAVGFKTSDTRTDYEFDPNDYKEVIMKIVDSKLTSPENRLLPASWYMFSMVLRRLHHAGISVLKYSHCEEIFRKIKDLKDNEPIKDDVLKGLLYRLQNILGIVLYFPHVEGVEDIVICDPSLVYRGISEIIFKSFDESTADEECLKLKKHGLFSEKNLKKYSKCEEREGQLKIHQLIIILKHLGIIAPVVLTSSSESKYVDENCYIIPCRLDDAPPEHLGVRPQSGQACSIVPLRIYFKCGYPPLGGFCYLFTELINTKGWVPLLPKMFSTKSDMIYFRNKVTFKFNDHYFVTLLSTDEYYEIHILHTIPAFKLEVDGYNICSIVWDAVRHVLSQPNNTCLREYDTGCPCQKEGCKDDDKHGMIFTCDPEDQPKEITAKCQKDKFETSIKFGEEKKSLAVWFKVPEVSQECCLGQDVEVSINIGSDVKFDTDTDINQYGYKWSFNDHILTQNETCNNKKLVIHKFEKKDNGTYRCCVSTARGTLSLSCEFLVKLKPHEDFYPEMDRNAFELFLNGNDIPLKVCRKLTDSGLQAKDFNLRKLESLKEDLKKTEVSQSMIDKLNDQPEIYEHPTCKSKKHCKQKLVLTVGATGSGTLEYQWIKDETQILTKDFLPNCEGVTSDSLEFTDLQPEHTGSYKCKVTSSVNGQSVESETAKFKVEETMNLLEFIDFIKETSECKADDHPSEKSSSEVSKEKGASIITGGDHPSEKCSSEHKDASVITGDDQPSGKSSSKKQICSVGDDQPSRKSSSKKQICSVITDHPTDPPVITQHPQSQDVVYGDVVNLSVSVKSSGTLLYQWKKDGMVISKESGLDNMSTFHISAFSPKYEGSYMCIVSNSIGRINSNSAKIKDVSPLRKMQMKDYSCEAHSVIGFVYLHNNIPVGDRMNISVVPDVSLYPKTTAYEVSVAPVVSITCGECEELFGTEMKWPIIIEIMVTAQLFNHRDSDRRIITLSRNAHLSNWEETGEECDVLEDRIRIKTRYFKYFTAIARFPPPTASVTVDPNLSEPAHPIVNELCVPELPGFKVLIPLKSVPYKTEIKATLYYDSKFCENSNETLATACVELEPHGIAFSENVLVQLPIPGYSSIIKENPDAKLILLYSPTSTCTNWTKLQNISVNILNVKGESFATFQTKRHSILKLSWQGILKMCKFNFFNFNYVNSILGRCEVFMTREVDKTSTVNFSIRAEVSPFAFPEQSIPRLHHYILHHSGSNPIKFIPGELHFILKLKDCLFLTTEGEERTIPSKIFENSPARAEFDIDLDTRVKCELIDGAVVAQLRIVQKDCDRHQCNLIKSFPEGRENTVLQHPEAQYDPPKITMHPTCAPKKRCKQRLVLTLRATGSGTLTYQWIKDETQILTEGFLPNCEGVTSDSLEFTDLQPEHSGSYKCKVTSSPNRQSVESNTAIFEVLETMELKKFISGNSECKDGIVTVTEEFEKYIKEYVQRKELTLAEADDGQMVILAQIYEHAKINYDGADIHFQTQKEEILDKEPIGPGEAKLFPNKTDKDITEKFRKTITYTEGSTKSTNTYSGWTVDGRLSLSAGFESLGVPINASASAGVGYKKGKSKANTQATGTERTEPFDTDIPVPKNSQVKVSVEKIVTAFECDVSNVKVKFDTSKSIECRVHQGIISRKKKIKLTKIFKIAKDHKAQEFTIPSMSGKFVWSETCSCLIISDPMPLQ